MWIFTPFGFFSIVHKTYDAPEQLTIRARVRGDLENLVSHLPSASAIREDINADYRFRITAEKDDVAYLMARLVVDLDYDNFKNQVAKEQGYDRAACYGEVWSTLYELQSTEAA
ncbi:MAG: hypothetical protein HOM86_04055 [Gemmatimonadetes bacterium]|jgi:hypothetical protein|nr:hypothetical protein [Gemmatimonadota bacterium]MBT5449837.1 hypothetical protein [Gemmatimonadota bacterium]